MLTETSIEMSGIHAELELCMNILDNIGFIPDDLHFYQNSEARFLIYRIVVTEVTERMMKAMFRLKDAMKQMGM